MDFAPAFQPVIQVLWYIIPLIVLANVLKSPWSKGWMGECLVNISARLFLDKNTYHLIRNVTLPTEDGTTQIDHIIVSPFGVFVVETKNMKGWIFGSAHQRHWTQKIYKYSQKFQNPLHQNYKHVKTLQALLGLSDAQIHSVVVFVGDATFKTEMPANVTRGGGYLRFIKGHTEQALSAEQVREVVETIASGRLKASLKTHRAHVKHVREITARKNADFGFGGANEIDRLVQRHAPAVKRWFVKPVIFVCGLMAVVSLFRAPTDTNKVVEAETLQVAHVQASSQQTEIRREEQARLDAERAQREAQEKLQLAKVQRAKEKAVERAFFESYVAPEGCDNWRSDRHMVECINHKMRAKAKFWERYLGGGTNG